MASSIALPTMLLFSWKPEYSVGIQEIDQQHMRLVSLLVDLHLAMKAGRGSGVVHKILADLVTYTRVHFEHEERLMAAHGYLGLEQHKRAHAVLAAQVTRYLEDTRAGKVAVSLELLTFLKDWLVNHILHTDKDYAPFLNAKGVR